MSPEKLSNISVPIPLARPPSSRIIRVLFVEQTSEIRVARAKNAEKLIYIECFVNSFDSSGPNKRLEFAQNYYEVEVIWIQFVLATCFVTMDSVLQLLKWIRVSTLIS